MRFFILIFFFLLISCSKNQSILICGDHKCINKNEAKQYFKENLTLEIEIISKKQKTKYNLVDLNIKGNNSNIKIFKSENKKTLKNLSKKEVQKIKTELKKKKIKSKEKTKIVKKKEVLMKKNKINTLSFNNSNDNFLDICIILEKCDIDSITNYLIKLSNEKDYPNISLRK